VFCLADSWALNFENISPGTFDAYYGRGTFVFELPRSERLAASCALAALLSPRQGFQPNRWRESLACITANRQSRHMGGFQGCPTDFLGNQLSLR